MLRGGSVSRIMVAPKSRRGVRVPKHCQAPIVYNRMVIANCYHRALTVSARVGLGDL